MSIKTTKKRLYRPRDRPGRRAIFGETMGQLPIAFTVVQREQLAALQDCEQKRTGIRTSIADVVRDAVNRYIRWYEDSYNIRLSVAEATEGGDGHSV